MSSRSLASVDSTIAILGVPHERRCVFHHHTPFLSGFGFMSSTAVVCGVDRRPFRAMATTQPRHHQLTRSPAPFQCSRCHPSGEKFGRPGKLDALTALVRLADDLDRLLASVAFGPPSLAVVHEHASSVSGDALGSILRAIYMRRDSL